jgi:hypothetical protein
LFELVWNSVSFFEPRAASLDSVLEDEGPSGNGDEATATAILRALYVGGSRPGYLSGCACVVHVVCVCVCVCCVLSGLR